MKIGVWLNSYIIPNDGGGFTYTDKLLQLIDKKVFSEKLEIVFLAKTDKVLKLNKEVVYLKDIKISNLNWRFKLINFVSNKIIFLKKINKKIYNKLKYLNKIEVKNQLINNNIDIIYYLSQTECEVEGFPFISTNWDIGHLSMYPFPEVVYNGDFQRRKRWYSETILKALTIFVESNAGKNELINYLRINPDRIKVVPIFPGSVVDLQVSSERSKNILSEFNLEKNNYFFYPAQFWAHKNHFNLLKAFKYLLKDFPTIKLIFTGSDQGNLDYIQDVIKDLSLSDNVGYLGFIPQDSINVLYKNTIALVMPTLLGPTNMPLLEARKLNCPVLCSNFEGHIEQLGDGAIYFDPLNPKEIYKSMVGIMNDEIRMDILKKANIELETSIFNEKNAIMCLEKNLLEILNYRKCWA